MESLFHIFEFTKESVDEIYSKPFAETHFHDFEELIIIKEGGIEHFIDFKVEILSAPAVCYISTGKMHRLIPDQNMRGWVINFRNEFLNHSILNIYADYFNSSGISLLSEESLTQFVKLCEIINYEYQNETIEYTTIRHLIYGLISMVDTERKRNSSSNNKINTTQIEILNKFLKILEENFYHNKDISFYADKMKMTERNLNIICKNSFQKSVSDIIETRKLVEAKRLLLHTNKTISEIGYELGYNEKSYFTRVFHNKMNMTPTRFREMTRSTFF